MKTLKQIIKDEKLSIIDQEIPNYGTDKDVHPYVDEFYEENFIRFKNRKITLVEIGVRGGASLSLWRNYFINAKKIYGLDNLETNNSHSIPVNEKWVSGENVEYLIGDAYNQEVADKIPNNIDIFIDDGPHSIESHIRAIELYLPKMSKNGLFIIEDILYDPNQFLYNCFSEELADFVVIHKFETICLLTLDLSKVKTKV